MAPEQRAGKEVTTRSDIYSLGLVLFEMFNGKRWVDDTQSVKDMDPTIERVILRCLDDDPRNRPSTALGVVMALSGGDPIAAALAAGETPSPEMVAASGEKEGFRPTIAILCFGAILLSLVATPFLADRATLLGRAPLKLPPDVLAFKAAKSLRNSDIRMTRSIPGTDFKFRKGLYRIFDTCPATTSPAATRALPAINRR